MNTYQFEFVERANGPRFHQIDLARISQTFAANSLQLTGPGITTHGLSQHSLPDEALRTPAYRLFLVLSFSFHQERSCHLWDKFYDPYLLRTCIVWQIVLSMYLVDLPWRMRTALKLNWHLTLTGREMKKNMFTLPFVFIFDFSFLPDGYCHDQNNG
jgi:hypothetical protein